MHPDEKKKYRDFCKILKKIKNKSELNHFVDNLNSNGIDVICRCLHNVVYRDIEVKKNPKNLKRLLKKNRENVEFLSKFSPSKKIIEKKRKVLQSGGFPFFSILSAIVPTLLSLFTKK